MPVPRPRRASRLPRPLTASVALAPLLVLVTLLGCPKNKGGVDAGPAPSVSEAPSGSTSASQLAAAPSSAEAPDAPPEVDPAAELDASLDASLDGSLDGKGDAVDDVPLMGTRVFPDETPARGLRKITSNAGRVHKAPKDGTAIASLQKGTEVQLVAELGEWYRVKYTDPATQQRRQGWLYIVNFIGPRMKTCPVDWTHHDQDGGWCDRECTKNTDCKALKGYKCSGTRCFYAAD